MGTCSSVRQWQPGQRRSGLAKAAGDRGRIVLERARGARLGSSRVGPGDGDGAGPRGRASASPDRVMIRSYRLRAVLGLGGGGKARGVSGLNGESSTLWGLLGTHVQAPGHSARGVAVRRLGAPGAPCPCRLLCVAYLPEAEAGPRLEATARALAAGGRSGPGGAWQVSAARWGPGVEGEGCIVTPVCGC